MVVLFGCTSGIRTADQARVALCGIIEKALTVLRKEPLSFEFRKPVDPVFAPDYYQVITTPMDIGTMLVRSREKDYTTLEDFHNDFQLMVSNCHQYNAGKNPGLPPAADALVVLLNNELKKVRHCRCRCRCRFWMHLLTPT
jgi:hypothetical protein